MTAFRSQLSFLILLVRNAHARNRASRHSDARGLCIGVIAMVAVIVSIAAGQSTPAGNGTAGQFTVATMPPSDENAYCGKGNVAKFGAKDGPAELPKTCYYTGLDGTPSPGTVTKVGATANLSEAVDAAKCGDTLLLPAGSSYLMKQFPRKNCDDAHYITIRTDTPDSKLPPEGTRISPAWGGVASLPGRPPYAQPAGGAAKLMATVLDGAETGILFGDHYRFIGIEWAPAPERKIARLLSSEGTANHIIFDRNWAHGNEGEELGKGLGINGTTYIAVIHSYFNNFTCIAVTGSCTDASAIGGGNKDQPTHALKIVDNFLEASGQNVFFGGAGATIHPEDVEIRRNHFFKPAFWNRNSPDHREPTPVVKNLFELKNAKRVLFEANLLENCWPGFSQVGAAIVLTPRNNLNKALGKPFCPDCEVTDVTIRYVWIRKVNQVLQIANIFDVVKPAPGNSFSIHDIVAEGLNYPECGKGCGGAENTINGAPAGSPVESVMHDVAIDHITYVPMQRYRSLLTLQGPPAKDPDTPQMKNISWTNTIIDAGTYGPWSTGGKPEQNCASEKGLSARGKFEACWKTGSIFEGNVLAYGMAIRGQGAEWPDGNYFTDSMDAVGFVKLNGGLDGDYHLAAKSKFKGKATDGRDPGADVDAVLRGIDGVR